VKFVSPAGKDLQYTATIKTKLGDVVILLSPKASPNHVRNFVALARAGYYNGLCFDRAERTQVEGKEFECLYAGCPEGSGDAGLGSIGYWMKPELNPKLEHMPGTVGAYHEEDVETAACKFYITLSPAPHKDGAFSVFGRVTQGLDVLRAIRGRPVHPDDFKDRPVEPVVMESVTIDVREVEAAPPR
jgi:peptidyl-prolyl cis-trans isomerase B (cyclophilin B)